MAKSKRARARILGRKCVNNNQIMLPLSVFLSLCLWCRLVRSQDVTATEEEKYLSPGTSIGCVSACASYHAGASVKDDLVCMYSASGVGTIEQSITDGAACFPSMNCREDWNVCVQWRKNEGKS